MTNKPRFLVGKGKPLPQSAPRPACPYCGKSMVEGCTHLGGDRVYRDGPTQRQDVALEARQPRFFVGDGSKAPPPAPPPPPPSRAYPVRANGCICARPEATGHVPGCKLYDNALYECEKADPKTIAALAKLASLPIADLELRRRGWKDPPPDCPAVVREGRRRCWRCPWWDRANATPIQLAYEDIADAALQGSTPPEGEDDGLPF